MLKTTGEKLGISLTLFAVYLGMLSIPGFAFSLSNILDSVPEDVVDLSGGKGVMLRVGGFLYGATALAAAIGLFLKRPWALTAIRSWMGSCVALLIVMMIAFPMDAIPGGALGYLGFCGIFLLVLFLADRVIARRLADDQG
ncbi:MAG: hypothetical protein AAGL69_07310 [Pseudomonadota bacterium]